MAKETESNATTDEALAVLDVKFGGKVSCVDKTCAVAIKISNTGYTQADKLLRAKQIDVSVRRGARNENTLFDGDEDLELTATTGKKVAWDGKAFYASLTFVDVDSRQQAALIKLAKKVGVVTILAVEELPEPERKGRGKKHDDHPDTGPQPIVPANGQMTLVGEDQGVKMPISVLVDFGISKAECEKLREAMIAKGYDLTIGGLELWINKSQYWCRDIPGIGEKKFEKLNDAWRQFREKYPKPTAEDADRKARAAAAYKEGCEVALAVEEGKVKEPKNPYPPVSPENAGWQRGFDETSAHRSGNKE